MNTFTDAQLIVSPRRRGAARPRRRDRDRVGALRCDDEREALDLLRGATASSSTDREAERRGARRSIFATSRATRAELRVTVLTTLQCNFACDYCFQGDHGDYNKFAEKMSLETAAQRRRLDRARARRVRPEKLVLTFFGGEPLLNLPVMYYLAERLWHGHAGARRADVHQHHHQRPAAHARGRRSAAAVRPERRQDHARRRPRHAQPDAAAARRPGHVRPDRRERPQRRRPRAAIAIGGNFDESSVDSYPALLDFLREQDFADKLVKVNFKPIIRDRNAPTAEGHASR